MSLNNADNIKELKNILSDLYLKYGTTDETLKLSQLLDIIIENQQNIIVNLRKNKEKFKNIIYAASDVIFEIDITNNELLYSKENLPLDIMETRDKTQNIYNLIFSYVAYNFVHPNDCKEFKSKFSIANIENLIVEGKEAPYMDLRFLHNNDYLWVTCSIIPVVNDDEVVLVVYAKNIHSKKLKELELIRKTQNDPLTNLYNKTFTKSKIENIISNSPITYYYFIIVDLDNFSLINKNLGHSFGDAVLQDISKQIKSIFMDADVIGRVGGDEFVVFTKEIDNKISLLYKLNKLKVLLRQSYGRNGSKVNISASMGVSTYPQDGSSFNDLYEKSKKALYLSKRLGKDSYVFYDSSVHLHLKNTIKSSVDNSDPIYVLSDIKQNIFEYIFRILYETKDTYTAINLILKIVGGNFNLSRVYIFEIFENGLYSSNTFEWCNEGIPSQLENMKKLYTSDFKESAPHFDSNSVFFCDDITTIKGKFHEIMAKQNIKSFMQCAVFQEDRFVGSVGFDECVNENRVWTMEERKILNIISNIISTFLFKERSYTKLLNSEKINRSILETLDTYTYVIDMDNFDLLYINKKIRNLMPNAKIGDKCHKLVFNKDKPCKVCPIKLLKESGKSNTEAIENYNPLYNFWTSSVASKIKWENKDNVCLISCHDISKYKK